MARFRKKPVEIEAFRWEGGDEAWRRLNQWLDALDYVEGDGLGLDALWCNDDDSLTIPTLEGDHRCDVGDWIIQGVERELYPCKPAIFAATYEAI